MRPRAVAVEPMADFKLLVTFSNNEIKIFDVKPYFDFVALKSCKILPFLKPFTLLDFRLNGQMVLISVPTNYTTTVCHTRS